MISEKGKYRQKGRGDREQETRDTRREAILRHRLRNEARI